MLATTPLAVLLALASFGAASPTLKNDTVLIEGRGYNGIRGCILGAIECYYKNDRCAKVCSSQGGSELSSVCYCPDGTADNPYTRAGCINIFTAQGRHSC